MKNTLKDSSFARVKKLGSLGLPILTVGLLHAGCTGTVNSSTTQFSSGRTGIPMTASQISDQLKQLQSPDNKATYEQARAVQLSDVYTNALQLAPSEPVELGGHTFDNLHDLFAENSDYLQQISDSYGTVGSYIDAMGITNLTDVTPEKIQAAYDITDKLFNQGLASSMRSSTHNTAGNTISANSPNMSLTSSNQEPHLTGLALGSTAGCVSSALGSAAAVVTAGAGCYASLGLACGAAALGAAGSVAGTVEACQGVGSGNNDSGSSSGTKDGTKGGGTDSGEASCYGGGQNTDGSCSSTGSNSTNSSGDSTDYGGGSSGGSSGSSGSSNQSSGEYGGGPDKTN